MLGEGMTMWGSLVNAPHLLRAPPPCSQNKCRFGSSLLCNVNLVPPLAEPVSHLSVILGRDTKGSVCCQLEDA